MTGTIEPNYSDQPKRRNRVERYQLNISDRKPAILTDIYVTTFKKTKKEINLAGSLAEIRNGHLRTTSIECCLYLHQLSYPL